jgi:hypothetical protein
VNALIVFVKEPRPGQVKTRLAHALGAEAAAEAYRTLALTEIAATRPVLGEYERLFFVAPAGAQAAVEGWLRAAQVLETQVRAEHFLAQQGADLGARMASAFACAFARGAERVAIVGTDVPECGRRHVLAALQALEHVPVALGPTHDGGYYLLALRAPCPALFEDVAWSTPAVLPTTLTRAATLGLRVHLLEELCDVDTLEDWQHVRARQPAFGPRHT